MSSRAAVSFKEEVHVSWRRSNEGRLAEHPHDLISTLLRTLSAAVPSFRNMMSAYVLLALAATGCDAFKGPQSLGQLQSLAHTRTPVARRHQVVVAAESVERAKMDDGIFQSAVRRGRKNRSRRGRARNLLFKYRRSDLEDAAAGARMVRRTTPTAIVVREAPRRLYRARTFSDVSRPRARRVVGHVAAEVPRGLPTQVQQGGD